MNEINRSALSDSKVDDGIDRQITVAELTDAKRPGIRLVPGVLIGIAGVATGISIVFLGFITPPYTAPASSVRAVPAASAPGVVRSDSRVIIPEGSPYRQRVAIATVEQRSVEQTRATPAVVEADPSRVFNVLPPLGGRVIALRVRLGDHVASGQLLATIDSGDLAQAYADADKARAQVALTRRALDRARGLNQVGGGAVKDVESATNDAAQAEAEFNRTQARLKAISGSLGASSNTRTLSVSAPASGAITALATAPGAYINDATQSMMTVTNLDHVWVTANLPERDIGFVSKGQNVDVTFVAYPGEVFHGTVLFVNDLMEQDTRRTKVRIGFDNPDSRFKPNMFATVSFRAPTRQALFVPDSALLMNNDATTVLVETAPWTFVRRPIKTGYSEGGKSVIEAGLEPGERIVVRGAVLLND